MDFISIPCATLIPNCCLRSATPGDANRGAYSFRRVALCGMAIPAAVYWPVPLSAMLCGDPVALSVMVTAADNAPVDVG